MIKDLFVRADEVVKVLGVSRAEAYRIIDRLNTKMEEQGYIVIKGRVNRKFFEEQIYGFDDTVNEEK